MADNDWSISRVSNRNDNLAGGWPLDVGREIAEKIVGLRKYMVYSFGTLWTVVLVIGLVATIIHQSRFQDSPTHIHLNYQVHNLRFDNQELRHSLHQSEIKYDNYRQWVLSWR